MYKYKMMRKILCLVFVCCINITSFAAIVSDNDGSAFVTKAEFDALKNSFQTQIENYNSSIDSKIDGAIASYLSGIALSSNSVEKILIPNAAINGVLGINKKNPLDYSICYPVMSGQTFRTDINFRNSSSGAILVQPQGGKQGVYMITYNKPTDTSKNKGKKTVIKNMYQNATAGRSIASWAGYYTDCIDELIIRENSINDMWVSGYVSRIGSDYYFSLGQAGQYADANIVGKNVMSQLRYANYAVSPPNADGTFNMGPKIYSISHNWGTKKYPYICVSEAYDYDMFSNYDRDYNYGYTGSYMKQFPCEWDASGNPTKYAKNAKHTKVDGSNLNKYVAQDGSSGSPNIEYAFNICIKSGSAKGMYSCGFDASGTWAPAGKNYQWSETSPKNTTFGEYGYHNASTGTVWYLYVPMIGFERKYLTNWKQIYLDDYDAVVSDDTLKTSTVETIISEVKSGATVKHLSVCAGFPVIKIPKRNKISNFTVKFDSGNASDKYNVWFKLSPFGNGDPDSDANCFEDFVVGSSTGLTKDPNKNHAFKVSGNNTTIKMKNFLDKDCILYMKWAKINNASDRTKDGGGVLYPSGECVFEIDNN